VLPAGNKTEYDSQLRHEVDADLTTVRYPEAGITIRPNDQLALSLVYRHEAKVELDVKAALDGQVDATLVKVPARYTLDSYTVDVFIPRQVVLGESYRPTDELSLNLDLTWVNWAAFESPISHSQTSLDVQVPPGLIDLPPNPKPTNVADPHFQNRIVPRVGIEYRTPLDRHLTLPLRVGYHYDHTPVPDQTGVTNYVDTDRHAFTLGMGVVLHEPGELLPGDVRFDVQGEWSILPTRVTLKDNPADYVGDYRARGNIFVVGAVISLGFE
jgi:long-chain fatty acid transport protein